MSTVSQESQADEEQVPIDQASSYEKEPRQGEEDTETSQPSREKYQNDNSEDKLSKDRESEAEHTVYSTEETKPSVSREGSQESIKLPDIHTIDKRSSEQPQRANKTLSINSILNEGKASKTTPIKHPPSESTEGTTLPEPKIQGDNFQTRPGNPIAREGGTVYQSRSSDIETYGRVKDLDPIGHKQELHDEMSKAKSQSDTHQQLPHPSFQHPFRHPYEPVSYLTSGSIHDTPANPQSMQSRPHLQSVEQGSIGSSSISESSSADKKRGRRFRRRYDQIIRAFNCTFPGCNKSYGSLNHLNTHIVTKKHGQRKSKADFQHNEELQHHPLPYGAVPPQVPYVYSDYVVGGYPYGYIPQGYTGSGHPHGTVVPSIPVFQPPHYQLPTSQIKPLSPANVYQGQPPPPVPPNLNQDYSMRSWSSPAIRRFTSAPSIPETLPQLASNLPRNNEATSAPASISSPNTHFPTASRSHLPGTYGSVSTQAGSGIPYGPDSGQASLQSQTRLYSKPASSNTTLHSYISDSSKKQRLDSITDPLATTGDNDNSKQSDRKTPNSQERE